MELHIPYPFQIHSQNVHYLEMNGKNAKNIEKEKFSRKCVNFILKI